MYKKEIEKYASDILASDNFRSTKSHIQHGNMSVHEHCISVALASLKIRDKFHINCSKEDLIRGALLHDYFLYDWHLQDEKNTHQRLHGFYHPGIALKNAKKEYTLNKVQEDIIKKHMWPLTIVPPVSKAAWIVTTADKYCSLLETFRIRKGKYVDSKKKK